VPTTPPARRRPGVDGRAAGVLPSPVACGGGGGAATLGRNSQRTSVRGGHARHPGLPEHHP